MPVPVRVPASSAPRVSFVIPSAADESLLAACLGLLEKHVPESVPAETIVVLDGASADAEQRVRALAPGAAVLASRVRLGLARTGNRGRARAKGEFVALLHDDAELGAGWAEAMLEAAAAHPSAGAFGGLITFPDGRPQTAGVTLFRDGAALPPWGRDPSSYDFAAERAVDFCPSNALFVRAAAWDAAGGLDPLFFPAYFVDADFARALAAAGWSCRYVPSATSRHRRGASSRRDFAEWVSARNRGLFVERWAKDLEDFEPWDGGSQESFRRALARAETRDRALFASGDVRRERISSSERGREREADGERCALEQELALQRDWARALAARLDASAAELASSVARVAEAGTRLEASAARLQTLEGLSWWRLYLFLLPLLKRLRSVAGLFSRPGSSSRTG